MQDLVLMLLADDNVMVPYCHEGGGQSSVGLRSSRLKRINSYVGLMGDSPPYNLFSD